MAIYKVHESLIEGLTKKAATIARKCNRYGCGFKYEILGEEYAEVEGHGPQKFYNVEAEGTARVEGWQFVATIQHEPKGNILRKALTELAIPYRYWYTKPVCEHCDTHRSRKNTYLVYNEATGEYKQVGKACLMEYTHGISADWAAFMASLRDIFDEYSGGGACGMRIEQHYFQPELLLAYTASAVKNNGYVKKYTDTDDGGREYNENNTAELVLDIYEGDLQHKKDKRKALYNVDETDPEAVEVARAALEWIAQQEPKTEYIHNLQVLAKMEYVGRSHVGILASLVPFYLRTIERERRAQQEAAERKPSEHVGTVGQRIEIHVKEYRILKTWYNDFGKEVFLIRFIDDEDNLFIWKFSGWFFGYTMPDGCIYHPEATEPFMMKGTIKEHTEYNGQKQTVLSRCKIISLG